MGSRPSGYIAGSEGLAGEVINRGVQEEGLGYLRTPCCRYWASFTGIPTDVWWKMFLRHYDSDHIPYVPLYECYCTTWDDDEE